MKFMKLGSKPDTFQCDKDNVRFVANELETDIIVNVGNAKFRLHKFPLLSKCARLHKLVATTKDDKNYAITISDIPGGPSAFEMCAKFCYGMTVTLNAHNVIAARCAAEYLEMHEDIEKGNLIYKVDVFLNASIFRSWKDSIIVLQKTKSLLPLTEDLKLVSLCINAIAAKASVDVSQVEWSYTYNRKKLQNEIEVVRDRVVPKDWWVEDLCELEIDYYKRIIIDIKTEGHVIGEALKAYAYKNLYGFNTGTVQSKDLMKYKNIVDNIVWLLPTEKGSVSVSFLTKLLKAAIVVESGELVIDQLIQRIGQQLDEASVNDLLAYGIDKVQRIVAEFLVQDRNVEIESNYEDSDEVEIRKPGILSEASKLIVVKLIDVYLAEMAKDANFPASKFIDLAEMVSGISRPAHDALYRAIDMYLKVHPGISKSERKRICKLMDCRKLSVDACMHAVQNERLPLRVVVQVLFFEQVRVSASSGCSTPDLPKNIKDLNNSSRSTTNGDEDWDALATAEELKTLKSELATLRLANGGVIGGSHRSSIGDSKNSAAFSKMKGLLKSKNIISRIWSAKGGENSSDSSDSLGSGNNNPDEGKLTPSRNRRYSVS